MKKLILALIVALTNVAFAEILLLDDIKLNYTMGDNDTKLDARRNALEQAKQMALDQAGTYVEVETIVKNGALDSDVIKSSGATFLKTKIKKEKYSFNGNSPILELVVEASIDTEMLKKNIEEAQKNDKGKRSAQSYIEEDNSGKDFGGIKKTKAGGVIMPFD